MVTSFSAVFTQATIFIQATIHLTRMIISPMKMTKMFTRLTFTFLVLISSVVHATTDVTVTVDRNPVMVNESFVLEIVANDSLDGNDLDLTPIRQSGLVVGRTATSSSTQIINGSISKTTSWNVVLLARKEGSFTIPSLNNTGHQYTSTTPNNTPHTLHEHVKPIKPALQLDATTHYTATHIHEPTPPH